MSTNRYLDSEPDPCVAHPQLSPDDESCRLCENMIPAVNPTIRAGTPYFIIIPESVEPSYNVCRAHFATLQQEIGIEVAE